MEADTALKILLALVALGGSWLFLRAFRKLRWLDDD